MNDRASLETDRSIELRRPPTQALVKIDDALRRIDEGVYGYCEETGEPIGLKRLTARPIATLSLKRKKRHERGWNGRIGKINRGSHRRLWCDHLAASG